MGCFDSVYFKCECGEYSEEVQTKAGACMMESYYDDKDEIPVLIAADLDGEQIICNGCGKMRYVHIETKIKLKKYPT